MADFLRRLLFALLLGLSLSLAAAEIEIANPQLEAGDEGYVLSADLKFEFSPRLEEAVNKGVVLYFVADFELSRPRWYWLDERVSSRSQTWRLSYHALTRQYRVSVGSGLHQAVTSLPEAVQLISRMRHWQVVDRAEGLRPADNYRAALRFRLDLAQLPRPFQITALGNKEWNLSTDWKTWQATLSPLPAGGEAK